MNPSNLFKTPGRPKADPADVAARRCAFQHLRKTLGMNRNDLARVTGLSPRSIGHLFSPHSSNVAATWGTIRAMRQEAIAQAKASVAAAEDRLFRAEVELQNLKSEEN